MITSQDMGHRLRAAKAQQGAFPRSINEWEGMTLRDWLVGQCLAGLCAGESACDVLSPSTADRIAADAVAIADAAIALLTPTPPL